MTLKTETGYSTSNFGIRLQFRIMSHRLDSVWTLGTR